MEKIFKCCYYNNCGEIVSCEIQVINGKITTISQAETGRAGGWYCTSPKNYECRKEVFSTFFECDLDNFLSMLESIQHTDSENFKYGLSIIVNHLNKLWKDIFSKFESFLSDPSVLDEILSDEVENSPQSFTNERVYLYDWDETSNKVVGRWVDNNTTK